MAEAQKNRSAKAIRVGRPRDSETWLRDIAAERDRNKVLVVVGTRPEVIKLAPVVAALEADATLAVELCVVHQQAEILDRALEEWDLVPDHRVELPARDRRLASTLGAMLPQLADIIETSGARMVIVEGDTTTNLAAALAAFYAGVPVAHVEAGLRSGDFSQPFPEEMHRVLVDRLSSVHYAPTVGARQNLLDEGYGAGQDVLVVGNTVVDALLSTLRTVPKNDRRVPGQQTLLVTAHRRENFGPGIASICESIRRLARERDDVQVKFVLHTNPAAFGPVTALLGDLPNVELIPPQPYRAFVRLLANADVVLTDSGGIQEEAPYLGKPVVVTREVTERPEASEAGTAMIVGTDVSTIVETITSLLDDPLIKATMSRRVAPYGDGKASERIRRDLVRRMRPAQQPAAQHVPVTGNRHTQADRVGTPSLVVLEPTELAS